LIVKVWVGSSTSKRGEATAGASETTEEAAGLGSEPASPFRREETPVTCNLIQDIIQSEAAEASSHGRTSTWRGSRNRLTHLPRLLPMFEEARGKETCIVRQTRGIQFGSSRHLRRFQTSLGLSPELSGKCGFLRRTQRIRGCTNTGDRLLMNCLAPQVQRTLPGCEFGVSLATNWCGAAEN